MGTVRNVSGEDRYPAELGGRLVMSGQVVEVPDDSVYGYTCQDAWDAADEATVVLALEQEVANVAANPPAPEPLPRAEVDLGTDHDDAPSGNASRDAWVVWAWSTGRAALAELKDLSRDEIRDEYGPKVAEPEAVEPEPEPTPDPDSTETPVDDEPTDTTDGSGATPQEG